MAFLEILQFPDPLLRKRAEEVRRMRIDYVQGYRFGRPMAEEDFAALYRALLRTGCGS